jgi:hypothetical protein
METVTHSVTKHKCHLFQGHRCLCKVPLLIAALLCELYSNAGISENNWIEIAKQFEEKHDVADCAETTD